jgi:hypothetical protein
MKRYFKHRAESSLGLGVAYIEFDGDRATRQVENYGEKWFCSDKDFHSGIGPALCDQPLSELGLNLTDEISPDEFERVWVRISAKICS